jgi:hypothetical protein
LKGLPKIAACAEPCPDKGQDLYSIKKIRNEDVQISLNPSLLKRNFSLISSFSKGGLRRISRSLMNCGQILVY